MMRSGLYLLSLIFLFVSCTFAHQQHSKLHDRLHRRTAAVQQSNPTVESHGKPSDISLDTSPANGLYQLARRDEYSCGPGKPCHNGACCGESGVCGFGPIYCGDGCTSNCDAKADCGQYAATPGTKCPLNVCCSQFGFCGTTSDFCGTGCQSNCGSPNRPKGSEGGDVRDRIVGYYEGWSVNKKCGTMTPSEIPVEGLTHLNFAFIYVDPKTYELYPMDGLDDDSLSQVVDLKTRNPNLKVWASVGGWSFNDPGNYQKVFSTIAGSSSKRAQFASNVVMFLNDYGFDGIDIDWEYPGADDRGGNENDIENYPKMLETITDAFKIHAPKMGLSITIPTSYWYLRWFDLPSISKYVNFINVMSYDLHGVWDSSNPIGPHVYAHTNLTEIDSALDLLWRNNFKSSQVNLGIGFYGRTFELKNSKCYQPGCEFKGPGKKGSCTNTAGILSYDEIQQIIQDTDAAPFTDKDAAVKYFVYGNNNWVSYDDRETFQAKIDFANDRGLSGLLIWAVDLDDKNLDALKAVSGNQDLRTGIAETNTFGAFDSVSDCYITECGGSCKSGYKTMVHTNLKDGKGCPNSKKHSGQRAYCCPEWGAPDPKTCGWRGTASDCYGQCNTGEIVMLEDDYGLAKHCSHGRKVWCCDASNAGAPVSACEKRKEGKCGDSKPQKLTNFGRRGSHKDLCCPPEPTFTGCKWYGDSSSCANNRCPAGKVQMARDAVGDRGWACVFGRNKVFCCDPPNSETPFLPVSLDNLFPNTFDPSRVPDYDEAFNGELPNQTPKTSLAVPDPNRESFAWIVMVADSKEDLSSLRKRDGSHLEVFDCPNVAEDDYSVQKVRAVCTNSGPDSNCEEIMEGGVLGTIIRLPEDCTGDHYVRAVSFEESSNKTLPSHLAKRSSASSKVYDLHFDYNLRQLRRDGGEVYFRTDLSNHPGYWNSIVEAPAGSSKRSEYNEKRWFDEKSSHNWLSKFQDLLKKKDIGLSVDMPMEQLLYNEKRPCSTLQDARLTIGVHGEFHSQLDYGMSLIGKLRNFDFSEAYGYFRQNAPSAYLTVDIDGEARVKFQSPMISFGRDISSLGGFNIKGLLQAGPYLDVSGQVNADGTVAGHISHQSNMTLSNTLDFMFPSSLQGEPEDVPLRLSLPKPLVSTSTEQDISHDGVYMVSIQPTFGFEIRIDAFGKELVDTSIDSNFRFDTIVNVDSNSVSCNGMNVGVDAALKAGLSLKNPLPGWDGKVLNWTMYDDTRTVFPKKCVGWETSSHKARDVASNSSVIDGLSSLPQLNRRAIGDPLIVDYNAEFIYCPSPNDSPDGDCSAYPADLEPGSSSFSKRSELEKRLSTKTLPFCNNLAKTSMSIVFPKYPESSEFLGSFDPHVAYMPTDDDCKDNYDFEKVDNPTSADGLQTEHILEGQTLQQFLNSFQDRPEKYTFRQAPDGLRTVVAILKDQTYCSYMKEWWTRRNDRSLSRKTAMRYLAEAYPGELDEYNDNGDRMDNYSEELVLLTGRINSLKMRLWSNNQLADPNKWTKYSFDEKVNVLRNCIFLVKYLNTAAIYGTFKTQVERVYSRLDEIENGLHGGTSWIDKNVLNYYWLNAGKPADNTDLKDAPGEGYTSLGLANQWKIWINALTNAKVKKLSDFITTNFDELDRQNQPPPANGTPPPAGDIELNQKRRDRIQNMRDAINAMGSVKFTNPLEDEDGDVEMND